MIFIELNKKNNIFIIMTDLLQTLDEICVLKGATPTHWEYLSSNLNSRDDLYNYILIPQLELSLFLIV